MLCQSASSEGGGMGYGAPGPSQGCAIQFLEDLVKILRFFFSAAGGPPMAMQGQFMPNVSRPQMTSRTLSFSIFS